MTEYPTAVDSKQSARGVLRWLASLASDGRGGASDTIDAWANLIHQQWQERVRPATAHLFTSRPWEVSDLLPPVFAERATGCVGSNSPRLVPRVPAGVFLCENPMQLGQLPHAPREVSTNWDAAARNRLRQLWVDTSIPRADLPAIMARPMEAIARMAHRMKLGRRPADVAASGAWTDADVATLRRLWPDHARDEIAREMGRTTPAISRKAHELGLSRWPKNLPPSNTAQLQMARDKWHRMRAAQGAPVPRTPERREILMRDWPTYRPAYEIAAEMNLLPGAHMRTDNLAKWARDMGLNRPADFRPVRDPNKPKLKAKIIIEREPPPEVVARRCLHCGRGFQAAGRFLRLCQPCRGNAW